jgi:hypothetical protein
MYLPIGAEENLKFHVIIPAEARQWGAVSNFLFGVGITKRAIQTAQQFLLHRYVYVPDCAAQADYTPKSVPRTSKIQLSVSRLEFELTADKDA